MPVSPATRFHLAMVLTGIAFGFTAPLTAVFATGLGAGPFLAGIAVSSISVFILTIDVFGTRWTPRLPARGALATGLALFGIGSLGGALAQDLPTMLAARAFQGVGVGIFLGVGPQLAVRLAGRDRAGRALGTFNAAWFAGIAAGPLLGSWTSSFAGGTAGLRVAFVVCGVLSLLIAGALPLVIPGYPSTAAPQWGLPRGGVPLTVRAGAVLGASALGQVVRSGVAMTLLPLVGSELGVHDTVLGLALSLMAVTDVAAMYAMPRFTARLGVLPPLTAVCAWGVVVTLLLLLVDGEAGFLAAAAALGVAVGSSGLGPAELSVDLSPDTEAALATYRIAGDAGLALGGPLLGAAVALAGTGGGLVVAAGLFATVAGLGLVAGDRRPAAATTPTHRPPRPVLVTQETGAAMTAPPTAEPATTTPHPTRELVDAVLEDQSMTYLSEQRRQDALTAHRRMRPALERLRARPLPFLDPVEPATAIRWIETEGVA